MSAVRQPRECIDQGRALQPPVLCRQPGRELAQFIQLLAMYRTGSQRAASGPDPQLQHRGVDRFEQEIVRATDQVTVRIHRRISDGAGIQVLYPRADDVCALADRRCAQGGAQVAAVDTPIGQVDHHHIG